MKKSGYTVTFARSLLNVVTLPYSNVTLLYVLLLTATLLLRIPLGVTAGDEVLQPGDLTSHPVSLSCQFYGVEEDTVYVRKEKNRYACPCNQLCYATTINGCMGYSYSRRLPWCIADFELLS